MLTDRKIDFEIVHKKRNIGYIMPEGHSHPYFEMGYFISGSRKVLIEHQIYTLKAGDLFVIPAYVLHRGMAVEASIVNSINLSFAAHYLTPLINRYGEEKIQNILNHPIYHFEHYEKKALERTMHNMIIGFRHPDEYTQHFQELFIQELFITLLRHPVFHTPDQDSSISSEEKRIQEMAKYISEHYDEDLTLVSLAEKYGSSTSYFTHKFKQVIGFGFKEYLTSIRIREACKLLIGSDSSITEIAFKCGFRDSNYFGDAFKKIKGVSPRAYRNLSGFI